MARKIGNQNLLNDLRAKYDNGITGPKYVEKENVEKEKQKNMKEIIDALTDAIMATGKRFDEIPKSSIISYLDKVGVNRKNHEEIYQRLSEIYNIGLIKNVKTDDFTKTNTSIVTPTTAKTKERMPRKSVFSEIKKIN